MQNSYPIDDSAILYLAQMGPDHVNAYRFTAVLTEPVEPALLQTAADRIFRRFPTIFAGFQPTVFSYRVVSASCGPRVRQDPGLLLTMDAGEIRNCAYRICYQGCEIIIEAFHALTDGYGAIASLRALLAEYVYLRHGSSVPEREALLLEEPDWSSELRDAYRDHCGGRTCSLPRYPSYQVTGENQDSRVSAGVMRVSSGTLQAAARRYGVSMTALLAGLLAEAIADLQEREGTVPQKPVRIMVPVDLRRIFPSKTFRNFILYALPTLTPAELGLPREQRMQRIRQQMKQQTEREFLQGQITRNVGIQRNILYRMLPRAWKCGLMRLSYRFFGEINSSITLTNLGHVTLSGELADHVRELQVHLTPRRMSPYNCAVISCGPETVISLTRFGTDRQLENLFFEKLRQVTQGEKD